MAKNKAPINIGFFNPIHLFVTILGVGRIPFMPGTWGSVAGAFLVLVIAVTPGFVPTAYDPKYIFPIIAGATFVLFILGTLATKKYESITKREDPSEVVIDEVVGIMLTYCLAALVFSQLIAWDGFTFKPYLTLSLQYFAPTLFILFRIFDITKPSIIGVVQRKMKSALGVMLDDVLAAIFAVAAFYVLFFAGVYSGLLKQLVPQGF